MERHMFIAKCGLHRNGNAVPLRNTIPDRLARERDKMLIPFEEVFRTGYGTRIGQIHTEVNTNIARHLCNGLPDFGTLGGLAIRCGGNIRHFSRKIQGRLLFCSCNPSGRKSSGSMTILKHILVNLKLKISSETANPKALRQVVPACFFDILYRSCRNRRLRATWSSPSVMWFIHVRLLPQP